VEKYRNRFYSIQQEDAEAKEDLGENAINI
jgi:hypothetical protein